MRRPSRRWPIRSNLVPDFLPGIGQLDDAILAALAPRALVRRAGTDLDRELWPGPEKSLRLIVPALSVPRGRRALRGPCFLSESYSWPDLLRSSTGPVACPFPQNGGAERDPRASSIVSLVGALPAVAPSPFVLVPAARGRRAHAPGGRSSRLPPSLRPGPLPPYPRPSSIRRAGPRRREAGALPACASFRPWCVQSVQSNLWT